MCCRIFNVVIFLVFGNVEERLSIEDGLLRLRIVSYQGIYLIINLITILVKAR